MALVVHIIDSFISYLQSNSSIHIISLCSGLIVGTLKSYRNASKGFSMRPRNKLKKIALGAFKSSALASLFGYGSLAVINMLLNIEFFFDQTAFGKLIDTKLQSMRTIAKEAFKYE